MALQTVGKDDCPLREVPNASLMKRRSGRIKSSSAPDIEDAILHQFLF